MLRRAGFFSVKQDGIREELSVPEAAPLQSCGNSLTVSSGSIVFTDQRVNTSVTRYVTISNPNPCPVTYNVSGGAYGFQISPASGTVSANNSVSIGVTFTPPAVQYYSGSAIVNPGSGSITFSGRGIQ